MHLSETKSIDAMMLVTCIHDETSEMRDRLIVVLFMLSGREHCIEAVLVRLRLKAQHGKPHKHRNIYSFFKIQNGNMPLLDFIRRALY